jgi:hypothetical protein
MNYIKDNGKEYIWDIDIINNSNVLITNNIYLLKDKIIYIFYVKEYNIKFLTYDISTRNELLLSLYIDNPLRAKGSFVNLIEKCCEFCFNVSKNTSSIGTNKFSDFIICKNCYINKKSTNYYINDRLFKSINSINIEMVKKVDDKLLYFYSIQQHYNDFNYIKLNSTRWYQVINTKLCQFCHKNEKEYLLECEECYRFSLDEYSKVYMKVKYLNISNNLYNDIMNIILQYYLDLIEFDLTNFAYFYNKKFIINYVFRSLCERMIFGVAISFLTIQFSK